MKSSNKKSKSEVKSNMTKELSLGWKKWDILSKIFIGIIGILIAVIIQSQNLKMQKLIAETTQEMENQRTEFSNKLAQGQLASSLIESLIKGTKTEKQMALNILKYTESQELINPIIGTIALADPDESVRIDAINVLEEKGKSYNTQQILNQIKEKGTTAKEREAASIAQQKVTERAQNELKKGLDLARIFHKEGLYQSAADEFKKIEDLLSDSDVDQAELALAKVTFSLRDYKAAAEHYIKATQQIH